jgi:hypothetical protein
MIDDFEALTLLASKLRTNGLTPNAQQAAFILWARDEIRSLRSQLKEADEEVQRLERGESEC